MSIPSRIPILYLILGVLILVSVVPMYFYADNVVRLNRDRLKAQEQLIQTNITRSLAEDIAQRQNSLRTILSNLSSAVYIASGGNLTGEHVETPELRALLEKFVSSTDDVAYASLLNMDAKGPNAGKIALDGFMVRELEHAFEAGRQSRTYVGKPLTLGAGRTSKTILLVSSPITAGDQFIGLIAVFVDLQFLTNRLREAAEGGLDAYVVDSDGRLVASASDQVSTGMDMRSVEIVHSYLEQRGKSGQALSSTSTFNLRKGDKDVAMLGTISPVSWVNWAVVAQKTQESAYGEVFAMQRKAIWLAIIAVIVSIAISVFAARRITTPLEILTESSRAIARGDFSQRVQVKSRTEIGELAETFNSMTDDLERYIHDLKRAAEENRALFLGSIQMVAGAVDEKDPYTKGHSDRVTRYSVLIAKEMGLADTEIEKIRIGAQLHDVGKIGIEDRILKKPGALTPEEFEIMKTHTTKGASILRPVEQLREMLPGIELHHESLDGRGYPYGLKGDQIPLMPRIIMVADTFDAMTTNRPYQAAMETEYVLRIINSLANTKFDPQVVAALTSVWQRGELRLHRAAAVPAQMAAPAGAGANGGLLESTHV